MKFFYSIIFVFLFFLISACTVENRIDNLTDIAELPQNTLTNLAEETQQLPFIAETATNTPVVTEGPPPFTEEPQFAFQGERAFEDVKNQVAFGPRTPGSAAHAQTVDYIRRELDEAGWQSELQETQFAGQEIRNIIGTREDLEARDKTWIILGAHYDSRLVADRDPDPDKQTQPVPGANDGASGVAVLLELARVLPAELEKRVWLAFFDAEDNGRIAGWDWILGSQAFVQALEGRPEAAVIVDMIGDADLNVYLEGNSDPALAAQVWETAEELGYGEQIINTPKHSITDDHIPFLNAGIPAIDIIDFDYPYWHTTGDTVDKVSPRSLQVIGDTLLAWLNQRWSP